jgi:predicted DCC family thiol-disulfide oxidoreductase YuxK
MGNPSGPPAVVLYDGDCGFCARSADRGRRHQRPGALRWLANGSDEAQALLLARGLAGRERHSLIVLDGGRAYLDSDAVVRSAQGLRWPWRALAGLKAVPKRWRDSWYRRFASRRGRSAECRPADRPAP